MAVLPVQLVPPTFPQGYCAPNSQQFANDFAAGTRLSSGVTLDTVVASDTPPADHTKLWFKTLNGDPFAYPAIPLYYWDLNQAAWVARHPLDTGRHTWEEFANASEIPLLDGGTAGVATLTTGPFWEIDTKYDGRSPMSPGVIQAAVPGKTLGYGEIFGEGAHQMIEAEVGPHSHPLSADTSIVDNGQIKVVTSGSGGAGLLIGGSGQPSQNLVVEDNTTPTSPAQQAMPIIHPVVGMSCIRRTKRIFYLG